MQIASRYQGATVEVDPARFALRVVASGVETSLPLAPLYHRCVRHPVDTAALIAGFTASVEKQLGGSDPSDMSAARLLWCVRSVAYIEQLSRAGDLESVAIGTSMVAFIAESLPGSIMRGVPRQELDAAGLHEGDARRIAGENTERHFAPLLGRISKAERVPADGWRAAGDPLFQGSILKVPPILQALRHLAGGDILIGVPDRGVVFAIAAALPSAERFGRRILREWREAMNPCSHEVLRYDGDSLIPVPRKGRRAASMVMPWLQE